MHDVRAAIYICAYVQVCMHVFICMYIGRVSLLSVRTLLGDGLITHEKADKKDIFHKYATREQLHLMYETKHAYI